MKDCNTCKHNVIIEDTEDCNNEKWEHAVDNNKPTDDGKGNCLFWSKK